MFLLVLNLLLTQCTFCSGAHILISSISASFGHWNSLLHIAKEALSRDNDHFITFIIDETFHHYLDTITKNPQYHNITKNHKEFEGNPLLHLLGKLEPFECGGCAAAYR
eukprot:521414_1